MLPSSQFDLSPSVEKMHGVTFSVDIEMISAEQNERILARCL